MQWIGHRAKRLIAAASTRAPSAAAVGWLALGAFVAIAPALWMWGFTVDDALISVRYARHVAAGVGWRFDVNGPSSDGVTPLPWPLVLAPMAHADGLVVLARAKTLGLVVWAAAGAALGGAVGRASLASRWARAATLVTLGLCVPLAAHAVSGMETALATALATTAALAARRPWTAAVLAGVAASLRPEMAPWACVLAVALTIAARESPPRVVFAGAVALTPFVVCAVIRAAVWGRPAPLALWAKPSDLSHGFAYAGAACVVTLVPLLVVAPLALRREPRALAIVLAAIAHVGAIVVVGGDWMPYARLMVPVVPSLAYAAVLASPRAHPGAILARLSSAIAVGIALLARGATDGRRVGPERAALVNAARPVLAGASRVAALDVGWVGAATDADLIDLAGVTDPEIAALPGGHTSKHVDAMFLLARRPDVLLLYVPGGLPGGRLDAWQDAAYGRMVEARLAVDEVIARHFAASAWLALGSNGAGYVVLRTR